jgi:tetratricopeptide (TPR) repeat protein
MRLVQTALILLLGFWVFTPALEGEWLFDDVQAILYNPVIHRATGLWTIWFAPLGPDYFPLKDSVQWLQWQLWGTATLGYHLTNIALHLASALLLWRLLAVLGIRLAWLGGLLFAVHPCTVESVAWMAELKNTLSLPLLLAAMLAYVHHDRDGDRASYIRALAAFLASLLCKTSGVMFPVVILLFAWWRHGRIRVQDWKRSLPFFGISLALGWVTMFFQHAVVPGGDPIESLDLFSRILCAGMMIAFYISKSFWPVDLDIVYFRWNIQAATGWEILCWMLLILSLVWLATRRTAWARHALFGYLFFLINLVPVLGFIRLVWTHYTWVADHFLYLPLIGLIALVTAALGNLYDRFVPARWFLSAAIAGIVLVLAVESHSYARLYQKSVVLWSTNIRRNPDSWMGHNNLGVALAADGDVEGAIRQIQLSLQVKPNQALAYINWGNALVQLGRIPSAIEAYREAISLRPDNPVAHYELGNALAQTGQLPDAIEQYQLAVQLSPHDVEARTNLADVLIQTGNLSEAIAQAQQAVKLDPDYSDARYNLGTALGQAGRIPEAVDEFTAAARLSPNDPQIHYNLGIALLDEGKSPEALKQFQRALELDPHYSAAQNAIDRLQNSAPR